MLQRNRFLSLGLVLSGFGLVASIACAGQSQPTPTPAPEKVVKTFPTPTAGASQAGGGASGGDAAGQAAYAANCAVCHPAGKSGVGPDLTGVGERLTDPQLTQVIRNGKGSMGGLAPAQLNDAQLASLLAYLKSLK